jgi:hypothetical protein
MKNHHHNGPLNPNSRERMHEAIAIQAYGLWLKSGRPDNQSEAHWLEAEREWVASRQAGPASQVVPDEI